MGREAIGVLPQKAAVHGVRRVGGASVAFTSATLVTGHGKLLGRHPCVALCSVNSSVSSSTSSTTSGGVAGEETSAVPIPKGTRKISKGKSDVVLSSGFLAFAQHSGFLQAVEEAGIPVGGVMGTSAGALSGSLYCAGYTPQQVAAELSRVQPIQLLRLGSIVPWRGGFLSLQGVIDRLREVLPPTFEDLDREFALGVVDKDGVHRIIDSGPLPEAVAASAAIPILFENVNIPGQTAGPFKDGGMVDRVGLAGWRNRRRAQLGIPQLPSPAPAPEGGDGKISKSTDADVDAAQAKLPRALVHIIGRSSPFSGDDNAARFGEPNVIMVKSPKSGVSLFHLGEFQEAFDVSLERARAVLASLRK